MILENGLDVQLVRIEGVADLDRISDLAALSVSQHLLVVCDFADPVASRIMLLAERSAVFSLIALKRTKRLEQAAAQSDTVPFFVASDEKDALRIVTGLINDPFLAVTGALNGDDVGLRYLEGRPS